MSQVSVKYVDPDCLFKTKGLNTTVIPVVPLEALREVVEGLQRINTLAVHNHTDAFDPISWLVQIAEESQRLLASLGEGKDVPEIGFGDRKA